MKLNKQKVNSAFIEPSVDNAAIHRACESVGFKWIHTIQRKGKWVNPLV